MIAMEKEDILVQADTAFEQKYYADALDLYTQAEGLGVVFDDEQLYRFSETLFIHGEYSKALSLLERIPNYTIDHFDAQKLLYQIKKALHLTEDELIKVLDEICKYSYDDELMYELAYMYARKSNVGKCRRICKTIQNSFRSGIWVEKANSLLEQGCLVSNTKEAVASSEKNDLDTSDLEDKPMPTKKSSDLPDFLEEAFSEMIGMGSVKQELKKFYDLARVEKLRAEKLGIPANSERSYNFVLYGNPGTGKTAVARIIGKVLYTLGIRENENFIEVDRGKIVSEHIGETAKLTLAAIKSASGGTLFVDEAYSLYKNDSQDFGQEAIDTLLKDMEDNRANYSVIMAGYRDQMTDMLNHSNPGFRSRFSFHIDIPDYSDDELIQIAHLIASKHHYRIDNDGDEAIRKAIAKERIDETFGNARFIRELIEKAELNMSSRLANESEISEDDLIVLKAEDIFLQHNNEETLDSLIEELDKLTGLKDAKKRVHELVSIIGEQKEAERRGLSIGNSATTMHMTFKGNAGTGKTTVARIIGRILGELGVLKRGNVFIECSREDVIGQYQGHTAEKMKNVIRSALGGVLFIDEAYSLKNGDGDSFGQEAINTLVAAMENYRESLVVILAGYTTDIDQFLSSNQGLRSRVAYDLFFEDYTIDEMTDIFYSMVIHDGLKISGDIRTVVRNTLAKKSNSTDFGNARGVRNIFELVKNSKAKRNIAKKERGEELTNSDLESIYAEDFENI